MENKNEYFEKIIDEMKTEIKNLKEVWMETKIQIAEIKSITQKIEENLDKFFIDHDKMINFSDRITELEKDAEKYKIHTNKLLVWKATQKDFSDKINEIEKWREGIKIYIGVVAFLMSIVMGVLIRIISGFFTK